MAEETEIIWEEEIVTPEEFCYRLMPKANQSGRQKMFNWIWVRLTRQLRQNYFDFCARYMSDASVKLLHSMIQSATQIANKSPSVVPGSVVEAFFPFADPPDLSCKLNEQQNKKLHKTRPALVVRQFCVGNLTYYLLVKISDAGCKDQTPDLDVDIQHQQCGLRKSSLVRLHTLVSIDDKGIIGVYGELAEEDQKKIRGLWSRHIVPAFPSA